MGAVCSGHSKNHLLCGALRRFARFIHVLELDLSQAILDVNGSTISKTSFAAQLDLVNIEMIRYGVELPLHFLNCAVLAFPFDFLLDGRLSILAVFEKHDGFELLLLLGIEDVSKHLSCLGILCRSGLGGLRLLISGHRAALKLNILVLLCKTK